MYQRGKIKRTHLLIYLVFTGLMSIAALLQLARVACYDIEFKLKRKRAA